MPIARARRRALYVLSFALGRGALFAAPLLLANLLAKADYGGLETAQAAASLLANAASLGTAGILPLVLLQHTRRTSFAGILTHHLVVVACCLILALICWTAAAPPTWAMAALFTAAVTLQSLGSTHLKTLGRGEASVLLDAGLLGLMALVAVAQHLLVGVVAMAWILGAACVYVSVLTVRYVHLLSIQPSHERTAVQWRHATAMGWPLMVGGIVSLLAVTSGRLGMGLLSQPATAADYAVLSRAAGLPIVAHQLVLIALFRNLFTLPHAEVELAAERIVVMVSASALCFWILAPWIGMLLGPAFLFAWHRHSLPGAWIVAQAVLWSAIALNDLVISRHQVMPRILPISATAIALVLLLAWLALREFGVDLAHFVYAHGTVMLLFYAVQSAAMAKYGIHLWRVWRMAIAAYLLIIFLATALT